MWKQSSLLLALASCAACQSSLPTLLEVYKQVNASIALGFLQGDPVELAAYTNATNKTVFIVPDVAIERFKDLGYGALLTDPNYIHANLQYTIVNGVYTTANFSETPVFLHSNLTNATYTNVTGGAVRKVYKAPNGTCYVYGSNNTNVSIVQPDIRFQGGVAHVISGPNGIPDKISVEAQNLSISSISAAQQLGLVAPVEALKDVTAFAYTEAGFDQLAAFFGGGGLANAAGSLGIIKQALTYSYINGSVLYTSDIPTGEAGISIKTSEGSNITMTRINGTSYANGNKIVLPDLLTANGVLHILDGFLLPPSLNKTSSANATQTASSSSASSTGTPSVASSVANGRNDRRRSAATLRREHRKRVAPCPCSSSVKLSTTAPAGPVVTPKDGPDRRDVRYTLQSCYCIESTTTSTPTSTSTPVSISPDEERDDGSTEALARAQEGPDKRR